MISSLGILFFGFIIVSYAIGVWVGTKIAKPKITLKKEREEIRSRRRRRRR
jgi:hypothetical protein